jgi:hypothetical protein
MKKLFLVLIIAMGTLNLFSQDAEVPGFYLESLNLGVPFKVPVSHYRGFSEYEVGFGLQTNFGFGVSKGLQIFLGADGTYNFNSSTRIEHLVDANIHLGFGWKFNPGNGGFTITPQISAGMIFHILYGDFMLDDNVETNLFIDQLYRFQLELAYTFKAGEKKKTHVAVYLSPSFEVFSGETYWGYIPGGSIGLKLRFNPTA